MPEPADVVPPAARSGAGRSLLPIVLWLVALAVVLGLHAANVAGGFRQLGLLDLQVYRMGGHAILHGEPLYAGAYAHDGLPFTYSPVAAVLFTLLDLMGWVAAAVVITAASLAALVRSCWICVCRATSAEGGRRAWMMAIVVLAALAAWPTRSTIELGQINILLMWLVLEDVLGLGRRARWSGVLTGLAAAIKLTPAFFVVSFALSKQ